MKPRNILQSEQNVLLPLQICEQQQNSFPYAANMKEITKDMRNHAIAQRIVVSHWTAEQPQTRKKLDEMREFFPQRFGKETFPNKILLQLEHNYLATSNIKYNSRTRRPSERPVVFRNDLGMSWEFTFQQHMKLDPTRSVVQKHVKVDLKIWAHIA